MYISQVEIDTDNRKKTRDLSHLGAFHQWVESSFPAELTQNLRSRKLWRIDLLKGKPFLLIVSTEPPQLKLLERYGVEGTARTKAYSSFLASIKTGMKARFKVTLNPVVAVKEEKGERGRVKPHVTVEQQKKYLLDRAGDKGFKIREGEFEITDRAYVPLRKGGQRMINLSKVTYEGILTITDAELFREVLTQGFGKEKAYGCGMMTIIPINHHG